MSKTVLRWAAIWAVLSVVAFVFLYWVIALGLSVMGLTLVIVGAAALDWEQHSTFEEREQVRARKRKEKWQRGEAARAKDRARYEAAKARQARKAARS